MRELCQIWRKLGGNSKLNITQKCMLKLSCTLNPNGWNLIQHVGFSIPTLHLHLGNQATSRGEAAHWCLKQDLQVSTNDLLTVIRSFERTVTNQHANLQHNSRMRV